MLSALLDVFRLRQYFNVITRTREVAAGIREDFGFVTTTRRALLPLPVDRARVRAPGGEAAEPFEPLPALDATVVEALRERRVAVMATGGSGALASLVGVARAFEDAGIRPAVVSMCSGSAMFGFPVAAGISADDVARFTLALEPRDYLDVGWWRLAKLVPTMGRGFGGLLDGDALEATYGRLLGDMRLADMPIPAYAPIWNVERNRVEYIGPRTYPDLTVARAVRMAVALPLFFQPVALGDDFWCDGGIVDIFPVKPVLDIEPACDAAVAVNGFYPPGFVGEDVTGWEFQPLSILEVASQVRTCQQVELARENVRRLQETVDVRFVQPVPYERVRGVGFYEQFMDSSEWRDFMRSGRAAGRESLDALGRSGVARPSAPAALATAGEDDAA